MSTLATTRVYVIEATNGDGERLLRAANKSRAARLAVTARIATQADMERLFAKGIKVEGSEPESRPKARGGRRS